jgi:cytoskeleton protein RodZ
MGAWRVLVEDEIMENAEFAFHTVGEKLKAERERRTLSLDEIAIRTRIPMRHLEAIEKSEYEKLPGSTYAIGFTRSYARALDMDDAKIGGDLRIELAQIGIGGFQATTPNYEPADLSSVPSRTLAWTAAAIGIAIIGGFLIWRSYFMNGDLAAQPEATQQSATAQTAATKPAAAAAAVNPAGEVVLTATDLVWVKIYDTARKRLFEAEMKAGDKYTVPKDADGPMIVTGRPQMLTVTIDGKPVAPLGTAERTIADVGVSAAALAARAGPSAASSGPSASAATGPAVNSATPSAASSANQSATIEP